VFHFNQLNGKLICDSLQMGECEMLKPLVSIALVATSISPPALARGPKPPPVVTEECRQDGSLTVCAYDTKDECVSAARALRRQRPLFVNGCFLSTADPDYWHYGRWFLEYQL
jgi:hypothetical protein